MLQAIIFDFDGVIVDSEMHHLRAFRQVLHDKEIDLSDTDYYATYLGLDDKNCFRAILQDCGRRVNDADICEMVEQKAAYYDRWKDEIPVLPGATEFVLAASGRYPLAIGSGALRRDIEWVLDRTSMRSAFQVVVSAEDIEHSKPAPDCYLTVLDRLTDVLPAGNMPLSASGCVVIEDALHGITAAKDAGMRCVAVTSAYPAEELHEADFVVTGLGALTLEQLESLMDG